MTDRPQEGHGYDFFTQDSVQGYQRRDDPLSRTMENQTTLRNVDVTPPYGQDTSMYTQPQQNDYVQPPNFIPVSEGNQFQSNQNMGTTTQEQFYPPENVPEEEKIVEPPPTEPLPENFEKMKEPKGRGKLEANFGFSSTHGVTYGHGPRRPNSFGLPPPTRTPPTNTMTTPQHRDFTGRPPVMMEQQQPPLQQTQPSYSDRPPLMDQGQDERLPLSHTPEQQRPPISTPPMMENQTTPQPSVIPPSNVSTSQPPMNYGAPPSQQHQPTTSFEAARQPYGGAQEESSGKPSHLPYPHHRKFNEEIPPPNTSSQFIHVQRTMPSVNIFNTQCSSSFMRATIRSAPNTPGLLKKFGLPFGVLMHPFVRNKSVPLVNLGFTEIIRCYSCRCYINPFCKFLDRGYKWKCNLCKTMNDVPKCYYSKLNESGIREDLDSHPELTNGSVEFVAPKRYHTSLTGHATCFIFMIDVSRRSIESGSLKEICDMLLERLDDLPSGQRTKVALITFNKQLHFYSLRGGKQPRMFVVGELEESLLPLPKDILVNIQYGRSCLKKLLKMLPKKLFPQQKKKAINPLEQYPMENAMFSALRSAHRLVSRSGGKLLIFLSSMPTVGRDKLSDRSSLPIPKQLEPSKLRYKTMSLEFSKKAISVDLFTLSFEDEGGMMGQHSKFDLGTLMALPRYTSGNHYPCRSLLAVRDGLRRSLTSITGFDAVMRVRVSTGMRISNFYGNFFIKGHDLLALPYCDYQKGFGVELTHGGSFISTPNSAIQCAVLYTKPNGERRIRVHNLVLPVTSQLTDLYQHCDIYAQMDLLSKKVVDDLHREGFEKQRKVLLDQVVQCVKTYRKEVKLQTMRRNYDQLVLADSIRLLPLYTLSLLKHPSLCVSGSYVNKNIGSATTSDQRREFLPCVFSADQRMRGIQRLSSSCTQDCILHLYPEIYQVDQDSTAVDNLLIPLTRKRVLENHMYLVNDGEGLKVWLTGSNVNQEFLNMVQAKIDKLNTSIFPDGKKKKKKSKKKKKKKKQQQQQENMNEEEEEDEEDDSEIEDSDDDSDSSDDDDDSEMSGEEEVEDDEEDNVEEKEEEESDEHPVIRSFGDLVEFQRRKYPHRTHVVELVTPEMTSKHHQLIFKLINDPAIDQKSTRVSMAQSSYEKFIVDLHDSVVRE